MSTRKSVLALAVVGSMAAPAAFATSGSTFVGGEVGYETHPIPSALSRAHVQREFEEFRSNPVTNDGLRFVGGEVGWVPDPAQRASGLQTRTHVQQELRSFRMNPVAADGSRYIGGEIGWDLATRAAAPGGGIARVSK